VPPICQAIADAIDASGLSQTALARSYGTTQQQISLWVNGREPRLDEIAALEVALDLHRGALLRAAGYVDDVTGVEDAIRSASRLKKDRRDVLLDLYRTWTNQA
jgi:transcriptional regulator with XRE-family HTH domain